MNRPLRSRIKLLIAAVGFVAAMLMGGGAPIGFINSGTTTSVAP